MTPQAQLEKLLLIENMAKILLESSMRLREDIEKTINHVPPKRKKAEPLDPAFVASALLRQRMRRENRKPR